MNERIKILIRWWKIKGQQENDDPFVKFFFFYVCFDAWITAESDGDRNGDKLNSFINGSSCLKESSEDFLRSPQAQSLLTDLKQLSPIKDMRPNRRGAHKELKDIHRLEEVVYFIYQIRNNLFHGSKSPMDSRDVELVDLAGRLLEQWTTWAYDKCL